MRDIFHLIKMLTGLWLALLISYLLGSFINATFSILEWTIHGRFVCVLFGISLGIALCLRMAYERDNL